MIGTKPAAVFEQVFSITEQDKQAWGGARVCNGEPLNCRCTHTGCCCVYKLPLNDSDSEWVLSVGDILDIETGRQEAVLSRANVEGVVVVDELGGEACCVASRTLTCTAVEVALLCTVDCPPLLPQVDDRQPAQPVHVLLKAWVHPQNPRRPRTGRDLQ